MSKRGGGFGACQKYWSTFLGFLTTLNFLKVLEERTVFQSLIHFQRPTKLSFTLFCRILQNVAIYMPKIEGGVQPIRAMPVFRPLFKKGLPLHTHLIIGISYYQSILS